MSRSVPARRRHQLHAAPPEGFPPASAAARSVLLEALPATPRRRCASSRAARGISPRQRAAPRLRHAHRKSLRPRPCRAHPAAFGADARPKAVPKAPRRPRSRRSRPKARLLTSSCSAPPPCPRRSPRAPSLLCQGLPGRRAGAAGRRQDVAGDGLSRNRNWAHPNLIRFLEQFSAKVPQIAGGPEFWWAIFRSRAAARC